MAVMPLSNLTVDWGRSVVKIHYSIQPMIASLDGIEILVIHGLAMLIICNLCILED